MNVHVRSATAGTVLAVAFFAVVVLVRTVQPLIDGDVWWHLRAGETVLRDAAVPTVDSWTIAGAGRQWISQDWASNVLMAYILEVGGAFGPTLLSLAFGVFAVVAFIVLWLAIRKRYPGSSTIGRVLCLGTGLIVSAPVLGVRVQSLDVMWIAITVLLLWGYLADRGRGWLLALPVLAVAWANTHAAWPLLFAFGGAILVGEGIDYLLGRSAIGQPPLRPRQLAALAGALGLCVPALLLNPNGARLLTYPFTTASISAHRDFLFEWSPPDISTFPGQALIGFLVLVVIPTLLAGRRYLRTGEMLWLVGLSVLALTAIRFVIAVGPVGAAVAAVSLAPALARLPFWHGVGRSALGRLDRPPTAGKARVNLVLSVTLAIVGIGIATLRVAPEPHRAAISAAMPVRATEWLAVHRPAARIFNVYAWGGYIGRELPSSVVYIDGRSDIYGDAPIREYAEAINLDRDPFEILDRDGIDVVVFWPGTPFAAALDRHTDWEGVYEDDQASIWLRRESG